MKMSPIFLGITIPTIILEKSSWTSWLFYFSFLFFRIWVVFEWITMSPNFIYHCVHSSTTTISYWIIRLNVQMEKQKIYQNKKYFRKKRWFAVLSRCSQLNSKNLFSFAKYLSGLVSCVFPPINGYSTHS